MTLRKFVRLVLVAGALALVPMPAFAQATGGVTGLVTDSSGGVLPGVTVNVTNRATGQSRSTVTQSDGFFTVPLLPPGDYVVQASLQGFRTTERSNIVVVVNETARADMQMQVGQVEERVSVTAQSPLVETTNATMGVVIDRQKVVDLPLNGRNFTQLGTLIPGVVAPPSGLGGQDGNATPGGFGNVTGGFNVNGQRNQSNNFLLDGAPNNDSFNTGFVLRPPPDAIQEFKILTHSYDAEYGRSAGSVVNVVTKSGTNDWHGGAWEFNRDDALQAQNYFATTKPALKQNQFGAAAGGPVIRNRAFTFNYVEGFKNRQGTTDTRTVLSAAQRAGDFSSVAAAVRDPLTGVQFPGNVIPANRINPIAARILEQYIPLPNSTANRVIRSPDVEDTRQMFGTRLDFRLNDRHQLLGRYLFGHTRNFNPLGGSNFSPAGNTAIATLQDVMGSDTWLLRPNMINVTRVSYNRIGAKPTVTSGLNLKDLGFLYSGSNATAAGLPFVTITGFFTTGDAQQPFASRTNNVFTVMDDFSWVRGAHSMKFGGELRRDQIKVSFINRPNGDFTFSGQYSGNAAADFLLGYPVQFRQATGDPNLNGASMVYALYAQDEFRLQRLTLNYGVRYEVNAPFVEKQDHLNAFHPGQQSTVFPTAPTGLVYPGDAGVPRGTYPTDKNNVAPRLAAVWDPNGDGLTSVRAAWGLFYDTLPGQGDFFQNGTLAPPFQPLTEVNFPLQVSGPPMANPLAGVTGAPGFPAGLIFIGWGPDFETPVVQQYNLTVQRQVGQHWGLEAGYVGSRGKHLPIFMEVNPTIPVLTPTPRIGPRLFPAFSLVRPTFSVAESWYNSLQASARMRPWHGINALASYTLGHAVDHVSGLNIGGESRPMLPVTIGDDASIDTALAREKGDALFDVRHRFVLSFGYQLPEFGRSMWERAVLGGWQVNGIFQAQTGFPLTVIEPNNISLTTLTNRPNMTCDPNDGAPNTITQYFNTNCFQRLTLPANAGQVGDEPRNAVRGPGHHRTDLSFFKNFTLMAQHQLQLRVEAFNIFNDIRFGPPNGTIGSPTFGQITTADDGRIVQLGLKYSF